MLHGFVNRAIDETVERELDNVQTDKQTAWSEFKRIVKDTEHENVLLDDDAFQRRDSGRKMIDFASEV